MTRQGDVVTLTSRKDSSLMLVGFFRVLGILAMKHYFVCSLVHVLLKKRSSANRDRSNGFFYFFFALVSIVLLQSQAMSSYRVLELRK